MKKINVLMFVTFAALAGAAGCEDEPEPAGVAGGGGGGAGSSGGGGAGTGGRMMSSDDSPPKSMNTGRVMTNAMGQTMAPITVSTPMVTGGSQVEVTLPMGTTLNGANGQPLSGEATVSLAGYNIEPEGIASFASDNMVPVPLANETVAAQASLSITVGGMAVESGSQPVTLTFTIPDGARDEAGMPYTPSTQVSYFVYKNNAWTLVDMGPLSEDGVEMKRSPNGAVNRNALRARIRARLLAKIARFSGSARHGEGN